MALPPSRARVPGKHRGSQQPTTEAPVEEPATPGEATTNLTWGIVLGGVLILFLLVACSLLRHRQHL